MAGSDLISTSEIKIGRFRLQNSHPFANVDINLRWNFEGFISTIVTGDNFQNITIPVYHTSNMTLESQHDQTQIPNEYKLLQNYPNPFNPSTTIAFTLPDEGKVSLEIYNVLGQKLEDIINEILPAGSHSVEFKNSYLTSGTYFCKLDVKDKYSEIIKMTLLK
jgi:hypothetical protein